MMEHECIVLEDGQSAWHPFMDLPDQEEDEVTSPMMLEVRRTVNLAEDLGLLVDSQDPRTKVDLKGILVAENKRARMS